MLALRISTLLLCAAMSTSCLDARIDPRSYTLDVAAWSASPCPDVDGDGNRDVYVQACVTHVERGTRAISSLVSSRTLLPIAAIESEPFDGEPIRVVVLRPASPPSPASPLEARVVRRLGEEVGFVGPATALGPESPWSILFDAWESLGPAHLCERLVTCTRRPSDAQWHGIVGIMTPDSLAQCDGPAGTEGWYPAGPVVGDLDRDGRCDVLRLEDAWTVSIRSGVDGAELRRFAFAPEHFVTVAAGGFGLAAPHAPRAPGDQADPDRQATTTAASDPAPTNDAAPLGRADVDGDGVDDFVFGCQLSESATAYGVRTVRLGLLAVVSGRDGRVLATRTIEELAESVANLPGVARVSVTPLEPFDPDSFVLGASSDGRAGADTGPAPDTASGTDAVPTSGNARGSPSRYEDEW